jgi:hypothetical protein
LVINYGFIGVPVFRALRRRRHPWRPLGSVHLAGRPIAVGIVVGLVVGKSIGILGASYLVA